MPRRRPSGSSFLDGLDLRALLCHRPFPAEAWAAILADDCHLRIGNAPPAIGRDRVLAALAGFLERTEGVGQSFWDSRMAGVALYIETDIQFADEHGRPCELPCVILMRPTTGCFQDVRVYLDPGPLR